MKLELKHLAPYLPYELKIARLSIDSKFKRIEYSFRATNLIEVLRYDNLKPILRPLSDLTKEIEVNEDKFIPHIKLGGRPNLKDYDIEYLSKNIDNISYGFVSKLIEWHFDVFGLIEKGLAIDINTLNK